MTDHATLPGASAPGSSIIGPSERVFSAWDQFALWFSLGVGLLVMQLGALLLPGLSPPQAFLAILVGSVMGACILGFAAQLGQHTGMTSAGLIQIAFGKRFGRLPVALNVVQLLGWAAFEIVIMRDSTTALLKEFLGIQSVWIVPLTTIIWGCILMVLMMGSMTSLVRRLVSRIGLPLVIASLCWLTFVFARATIQNGWGTFWNTPGTGQMSFLGGVDLVIAMPISWLPLVADYARFGRGKAGTGIGTFSGYVIANVWCYALGMLVVFNQPSSDLVTGLLLAQGGVIALTLIAVDELDNAYGDVYSGSVSSLSLLPGATVEHRGVFIGSFATVLALILPMHSIEPFLLILSSIFVPLFGVILTHRHAIIATAKTMNRGGMEQVSSIQTPAVIAWVGGVIAYHAVPYVAPTLGQALPSLFVSVALASALKPRLASGVA